MTPETIESFVGVIVALHEGKTSIDQEAPALSNTGRAIWLQTRRVDTEAGLPGSNILVGLADVTHMKARNDAMSELVRAKDEFIAQVSHELRTPLTAVVGLTSELNTMQGLDEDERIELVSISIENSNRCSMVLG